MKFASWLAELQRRNVLRAGVLYAGAVWALAQGISQLGPSIGLPDWATRWFLVAAVIGFPFWLAFAWFYEFTPSGLKRESAIAPGESITHLTGRKLDFWIIGILAVAVVLLVTNQFVRHQDPAIAPSRPDAKAIAAVLAKVPPQSVAVLPLVNASGDSKQQYFSDGLSEELISDLTQIDGLKVIGKYSSFSFRNSKDSPAQIGAALGVANLIRGSVRQQGDRIRVTVDMIRAADGSNVWSHRYEKQLKDVFAIQTEIGEAVASALKITLLGKTIVSDDQPPGGKVEAYRLMLQGRAVERRASSAAEYQQSIVLLRQALKIDPHYAYVLGVIANTSINMGQLLAGDAREHAYSQARIAADRQQALAPDAAATHLVRGFVLLQVDNEPDGALAEYQRALARAPNDATIMSFLAGGLQNVGQLQAAADLFRKAIDTDPLRTDFYANLVQPLLGLGQFDAAEQTVRKALVLQPGYSGMYSYLTQLDILRGDDAAALRDAQQETDPVQGPWARAAALQISPHRPQADAALRDYVAKNGPAQPYLVADLYAVRKQPDPMLDWLQRAVTQHDPLLINTLLSDPFVLAYQHDPRFAALCQQASLPLPGAALRAATDATATKP